MKVPRLTFCITVVAALCATTSAQKEQSGFHSVACYKVKPENNVEFSTWLAGDSHKLAQVRVDSGAVSSYLVLRSVYPQGATAECDYVVVIAYPGIPPRAMSPEESNALLQKAGITGSRQQFIDRRTSLASLVFNSMFRNQEHVGDFTPGDYVVVNYIKVANDRFEDYLAWENRVWRPIAEAMVKEGVRSGWSLNTRFLPSGSEQSYQAVTVDIYPSWESIYRNDPQFEDRWRKIHPDMELRTTMKNALTLRSITQNQLYIVQDLISSTK